MSEQSPWLADAANGATHRTYVIRTVSDFLSVPEERRRICLREFDAWLSLQESVPELLKATAKTLGGEIGVRLLNADVFAWMDDGKATMRVNMQSGGDEAQGVSTSTDCTTK